MRAVDPRADRAADRAADRDDREQAAARLLRVGVVRVRPELRDDRQAEDADPDVEVDADVIGVGAHAQRERHDVGDEEQRHPQHQLAAVDRRREPAVGRHEAHEQQRLAGRRVGLDLGRVVDTEPLQHLRHAGRQDQRLADGLQDVVADQDQEDVHQHQQRAAALAGAHVAEETQQAVDRAARFGRRIQGARAHGRLTSLVLVPRGKMGRSIPERPAGRTCAPQSGARRLPKKDPCVPGRLRDRLAPRPAFRRDLTRQRSGPMGWIVTLIVGGIIGWLASMLMKTDKQMGILANVVVGIIGSSLGFWLAGVLGFAAYGVDRAVGRRGRRRGRADLPAKKLGHLQVDAHRRHVELRRLALRQREALEAERAVGGRQRYAAALRDGQHQLARAVRGQRDAGAVALLLRLGAERDRAARRVAHELELLEVAELGPDLRLREARRRGPDARHVHVERDERSDRAVAPLVGRVGAHVQALGDRVVAQHRGQRGPALAQLAQHGVDPPVARERLHPPVRAGGRRQQQRLPCGVASASIEAATLPPGTLVEEQRRRERAVVEPRRALLVLPRQVAHEQRALAAPEARDRGRDERVRRRPRSASPPPRRPRAPRAARARPSAPPPSNRLKAHCLWRGRSKPSSIQTRRHAPALDRQQAVLAAPLEQVRREAHEARVERQRQVAVARSPGSAATRRARTTRRGRAAVPTRSPPPAAAPGGSSRSQAGQQSRK